MSNSSLPTESRSIERWVWGGLLLSPIWLLATYVWQTMRLEQYHYLPALFIAFGFLFYWRWDRTIVLPHGLWTWLMLGGGVVTTVLGALYWSPWLGCVGFLLILGAALKSCNADTSKFGLLALWPATWLLIRLPLNLDFQLTSWLQSQTARVSSHILDRLGITHRLSGNVFYLPKGNLFVEEACSGIQSVFALLFCAVFWVVWQRRSAILLPLYILCGVAWAGVMNILRVTIICVSQERWQIDLSHGWPHELLGYFCLFIAIGLLVSADRLIRILFYPLPTDADSIRTANPILDGWNYLLREMGDLIVRPARRKQSQTASQRAARWALPVAAALIPIVIIPEAVCGFVHWTTIPAFVKTEYWKPAEQLLAKVDGLEVLSHETSTDASNPALGIHSDTWVCRVDGMVTRALVSQHAEVHDLCKCYSANGWKIQKRSLVEAPRTDQRGLWDVVEASFLNNETIFGELLFSTMDRQARPVRLKGWGLSDIVLQRIDKGDEPQQSGFDGQTLNIQLWTTSETPFDDQQRERLRSVHRQIRDLIREDLSKVQK